MHYDAADPRQEMRIAAVAAGDVTYDREAEARTRGIDVETAEALKDGFLLAGRDAGAFVGNFDRDAIGALLEALDPRAHLAAAVQDGVLQEVAHHIAQVVAVAAHLD